MRLDKSVRLVLLALVVAAVLHGCSTKPDCISYGKQPVCGVVLDFYRQHGGPIVFGYPITDKIRQGELYVQYFENAIIQVPVDRPAYDEIELRALGTEQFGLEPREIPEHDPDCRYFEQTGHSVCLAFLEFFDLVGGERVVGQPLSKARAEGESRAQYFENAKLKWVDGQTGIPHVELEAWGRQSCMEEVQLCDENWYAGPPLGVESLDEIEQDIREFVSAHGGELVFGERIGSIVHIGDMAYVYYHNACVVWVPGLAEPVSLAPLGAYGAPEVEPIDPPPASESARYFDETGHSVVLAFLDFYQRHGAEYVFGLPLTEFMQQDDQWVQWFESSRYEWHPGEPNGSRVQLSPLGKINYDRFGGGLVPILEAEGADATPTPAPQEIILRVVPQNGNHPRGEPQIINLLAHSLTGEPLAGIEIKLYVASSLSQELKLAPPTDSGGSTWVRLDSVEAACGELVELHAVTESTGALTIADSFFTLWCKPDS